MGQWDETATNVATLYNPRTHHGAHHICRVAVINTAPHDIHLERGDFLGAVEVLEQHHTEVHSVEAIQAASLFASATTGALPNERLQDQVLNNMTTD